MFLTKTTISNRILHAALMMSLMLALLPGALPVQAVSANVVISQVYGGGGGGGSNYTGYYQYDYVELFNRGAAPVDISGWSLQYGSATGNFGSSSSNIYTFPAGTSLPAGKYLLVQLGAAGSAGNTFAVPPDFSTTNLSLSSASGKVALANTATALGCGATATPCSLPDSRIVDLAAYGSSNNGEGGTTINNGTGLSTQQGGIRKRLGCQDTDNNNNDFSVASSSALVVHNAASPVHSCDDPTAESLATPAALFPNASTLLTVSAAPGANPASSTLTVTCDLTAVGGSATQVFFDDGTNGDVTPGDRVFSFSVTVPGTVSGGAKTMPCTVTDDLNRTGSAVLRLNVYPFMIGQANGPVLDTDNGAAHSSPFVGQTITVQGIIYEKTLQAVSNSSNTYKGFFIQSTAATSDADPNTSNGLFVFLNTSATLPISGGGTYTPTVGDEVILSGTLTEYFNMTELTNPTLAKPLVRSGVVLDTELPAVVANPPVSLADANRYWERLQGMRVQAPQNSLVIGGRNVFSPADAEIWLVRSDSSVAQRTDPFSRRAFRDAHPLDDNFNATTWDGNGYRILLGSLGIKDAAGDAQALIVPARSFDILTNAPVGGINYSFSKYRIEVGDQPTFTHGVDPATNNPPEAINRSSSYSIVDYNLENLYDFRDNPFSGCDFAGNTGCSNTGTPFLSAVNAPFDYVPASNAAYQARLTDIAKQIVNDLHNPDIIMVQEVENQDICTVTSGALTCGTTDNADGKPDVLQELALAIAANGGPAYDAAFDRDSADLRGILPAFLYRTDRVQLLTAQANDPVLGSSPTVVYPGTPAPNNSQVSNPKTLNATLPNGVTACETSMVFPRAADIGLFRITSTNFGKTTTRDVYLINNHFKSGPDTCVTHRTEQAKYNAAIVQAIQAANPDARIVLAGDLNVYPRPDDPVAAVGQPGSTDQLGSLYDPNLGLKNLWDVLVTRAPQSAYSYVYLGMAQTLDQMFVNRAMLKELQQVNVAHINSDFPADDPSDVARGTSDHDPTVAVFSGSNTFYFPTIGK